MQAHLFSSFLIFYATILVGSDSDNKHSSSNDLSSVRSLLFFSPCTFPVAYSGNIVQNREHYRVCGDKKRHFNFVCDLHFQFVQLNVFAMTKAFEKHRVVLEQDGRPRFEIIVVKHLAAPLTTNFVNEDNAEFECLFRTPCLRVTPELIDRFVHNSKTFTRVYTMALFERWFPEDMCRKPRVLALVVVDGLLADPRKLTSVNLHTDDKRFAPFIANIQLEATTALLQGMPLVDAMADLIDQVGYAYRDFYATQGHLRRHIIPLWAWEVAIVSVVLVIIALCIEWYIVRRTMASKRSVPGLQTEAVRSKTHLIF